MTEQETPPTLAMPNAKNSPTTALGAILAELWRYKLVIPTVAVLVLACVAFWTMRQPKIYEAVATLEYDPHPVQPLGRALEDENLAGAYWGTQEFYETQNFILRSRSIAERVVRQLRLQADADFMRSPDGTAPEGASTVEAATTQLMDALQIEQVRDTRVVRIRARDRSPDRAQRIANAVSEAYIDKSLEDRLGSSARALEWLSEQMQGLKKDLEASELALYKFREQNHTLSASLEERQSIIASQLHRYSDAYTDIHGRRIQVEARLSVLRSILDSEQDLLTLDAKPIGDDQIIASLREAYRRATEELGRLLVVYGEAHPQVRAARTAQEYAFRQLKVQGEAIYAGVEAEQRELERAETGIQRALDQVNQQGLKLSLQEIDYTRLDRERDSKSELYDVVMEKAAQTDLTRAMRVATGRTIDSAIRPVVPVSPRVRLILLFGGVIGLVLGVVAALGVSFLDNKVRGPADMEARGVTLLGILPSLGSTPSMPSYGRDKRKRARRLENQERDLVVHLEPRSTAAECCRTIRTNITFQSADRPLRTIAITSAMPKDGKTTISVSIATILAQGGRRVLLVDTDLRKPRLHRVFKIPSGPGITTVLAGEATIHEVVQSTDVPGLTLMQCGPLPPNPSELLHTRRFAEIVEEARNNFDTVIFDSPPLGAVTDPAIISTQVDGTIVVVRSGSTTRNGVDAALRQLRGVSSRIIGAVLNGVDLADSNYGSYYAYYKGYYEEEEPKNGPPSANAARPST